MIKKAWIINIVGLVGLCTSSLLAEVQTKGKNTLVKNTSEFSASSLIAPEYRGNSSIGLLNSDRFQMNQSYSLSFSANGHGSSSSGLYLNTISYKLANPLILELDWGFHTPFHSTMSGNLGRMYQLNQQNSAGSLILPRIGLEYRPTENSLISINYFNGNDALKAYGNPHRFGNPW